MIVFLTESKSCRFYRLWLAVQSSTMMGEGPSYTLLNPMHRFSHGLLGIGTVLEDKADSFCGLIAGSCDWRLRGEFPP